MNISIQHYNASVIFTLLLLTNFLNDFGPVGIGFFTIQIHVNRPPLPMEGRKFYAWMVFEQKWIFFSC